MIERTDRYDTPPVVITRGDFRLHVPTNPSLVPVEFPAHIASREYINDDLPLLRRAELNIVPEGEGHVTQFLGVINFDTPASCQNSNKEKIKKAVEERLYKRLAFHENNTRRIQRMKNEEGIIVIDPLQAMTWVGVTEADQISCQVELTAPFNTVATEVDQLAAVRSVTERWVELQEAIVRLSRLPYNANVHTLQENIYVDMRPSPGVSNIEFALMEVMSAYGDDARLPAWGDDVNSSTLSTIESSMEGGGPSREIAAELITTIRRRHEAIGYMQPLDQMAIIDALVKAIKSQK